jgi:ATP-dependent RNA helicase DeaD
MTAPATFDDLSPEIRAALEGRGFTALTPVQEAVLDPALAGRDLRIFSQTGSGKTVAVGLAIAPDLERVAAAPADEARKGARGARPFALVVAPTRELAAQIGRELSWLYAPLGVNVTVVTGGASYPKELAELRKGPLVVAGTPGRLIDHLSRKSIDPTGLGVVVLDEADQMLDLGFRDELEAILDQTPETRRTLLLSATFPREVQRLADRCQKDAVVAAGTGAGERHADIAHVAHIVRPEERDRALRNLLLMAPGERALVFVRTREGAAELADDLSDAGLPARAIHGDLEQRDRTRTLDAFRSGAVATLVATDVAARGLDVPDVTRVIHADPPNDAEVLTHRSGRTGRAGKKGISIVLVPPGMRERVRSMLRRAGVEAVWSAAPNAADVMRAADDRLAAEILTPPEGEEPKTPDPRLRALAQKLLAAMDPEELVTTLLARAAHAGPCAPSDVTPILPPTYRAAQTSPPPAQGRGAPERRGYASDRGNDRGYDRGNDRGGDRGNDRGYDRGNDAPPGPSFGFVPFRINWGERHGADPRRLLAMVCRRGGIRGSEVGAIRIGVTQSTFEVAAPVAEGFARAAQEPDTRDPRIHIQAASERPRPGSGAVSAASAPVEATDGEAAERPAAPPVDAPNAPAPKHQAAKPPAQKPYAAKPYTAKPHAPKAHAPKPHAPKPAATPTGTAPPKRRPRWAE